MLRVWRAFFAHRKLDERGSAEFATALMVFPVMFVLIIGSIEMGFYVQTRMRVENIARDSARQVAAQGGNLNERTTSTDRAVDVDAQKLLWDGTKCKLSQCAPSVDPPFAAQPNIDCSWVTDAAGTTQHGLDVVKTSGDTVTCKVDYPYKGLSGGLMNGPMGLGIGGILKPFHVSESARSETGTDG